MIWRIRSRAVFAELRATGQRVRSGNVRMTFCPQVDPHPSLAFAFSRKFGNAVERNRAQRRLRAAFGATWNSERGPHGAFLLTGSRGVLTAEFDQLLGNVDRCLEKLVGADRSGGGSS